LPREEDTSAHRTTSATDGQLGVAIEVPGGVRLSVRETGTRFGPTVMLLHGLTLTRELVLMGSTKLEYGGFRVIACDARGHGRSSAPADRAAYGYRDLAEDVVGVMNALRVKSALLVGTSMGCHTALRVALDHPDRVAGIVGITPGFDPQQTPSAKDLREADLTADLLRRDGIEGFLQALDEISDPLGIVAPEEMRRRMSRHRDLGVLADAVQHVVRSRPFESLENLAAIRVPALVVGSRDAFDPRHPLHLATAYAAALPRAELYCEAEGRAPVAWSRRRLGNRVLDFAQSLG
jgi:pimeloyl-ACP methyl ester carboxylesterase